MFSRKFFLNYGENLLWGNLGDVLIKFCIQFEEILWKILKKFEEYPYKENVEKFGRNWRPNCDNNRSQF